MKLAVDLSKLSEDDRIRLIGNTVMNQRLSTWCLTDDVPGKVERYRAKLKDFFPMLILGEEIKRGFPAEGCAGFTVKPPKFQ